MKCAICKEPATKKVIWADGRAYQPSCAKHVRDVQLELTRKNGKMTELAGVQDLSNPFVKRKVIDLVASAAYPSLERKPGGPDNWVERAGGLPKYIERIAKHLHYEKGFSISRAIATAVNTVKRWARMGKVAKYGDPNKKHVSPKTALLAANAVAQWEAKKKAGKINLSDVEWYIIDMTEVSDEFCFELDDELQTVDLTEYDGMGAGAEPNVHAILASMDIQKLAERANAVEDPEARAEARARVLDLAFGRDYSSIIDLASTIAPRNARGKATDGRRSYKGQGKWKHGFVPANQAAHEAKAKGSPIAIKRTKRLFGKGSSDDARSAVGKSAPKAEVHKPAKKAPARVAKSDNKRVVQVKDEGEGTKESSSRLSQLRNTKFEDRVETKHSSPKDRLEANKQARTTRRAEQPWDEIPDEFKTVRNGKKYVVASFGGKQVITEWSGGTDAVETKNTNKVVSITSQDAMRLSGSKIRALLADPGTPKSAKRTLNRALAAKGGK